jgi:hypothetical protein
MNNKPTDGNTSQCSNGAGAHGYVCMRVSGVGSRASSIRRNAISATAAVWLVIIVDRRTVKCTVVLVYSVGGRGGVCVVWGGGRRQNGVSTHKHMRTRGGGRVNGSPLQLPGPSHNAA